MSAREEQLAQALRDVRVLVLDFIHADQGPESICSVIDEVLGDVTVHQCPPVGGATTPCCNKSPFDLPRTDRLVIGENYVTCGRPS